jgi:hypothetical protein
MLFYQVCFVFSASSYHLTKDSIYPHDHQLCYNTNSVRLEFLIFFIAFAFTISVFKAVLFDKIDVAVGKVKELLPCQVTWGI